MRAWRATERDVRNLGATWAYALGTQSRQQAVVPLPGEGLQRGEVPVGSVCVFTDSDHAADMSDCKSVSGALVWVYGGNGEWFSVSRTARKQATVSLSSGEAETVAAVEGSAWAIGVWADWAWLNQVTRDSTRLFFGLDSSAAVSICRRRGSGRRTRHLEIKDFYLQGLVRQENVTLHKVAGAENWSDLLTKIKGDWADTHLSHAE